MHPLPSLSLGTQTVFGAGPTPADVMLVGEQPGDQEDRQGEPFVGPASRMLDRALDEAGIDRSRIDVINAVKHFKNVPRDKRRIHQKPNAGEIDRCKWWLIGVETRAAKGRPCNGCVGCEIGP